MDTFQVTIRHFIQTVESSEKIDFVNFHRDRAIIGDFEISDI